MSLPKKGKKKLVIMFADNCAGVECTEAAAGDIGFLRRKMLRGSLLDSTYTGYAKDVLRYLAEGGYRSSIC